MIELKNLSFSYTDQPFLQNCGACFEGGTLCAVIGPNGSGKSTLLRLMCRQLLPQSGELLLEGRAAGDIGRKEFARAVGFMPQTRIIPEMTVEEYVGHGRYPYLPFSQTLSDRDRAAIGRALKLCDMERFASRSLRGLSGGERQRAYLALLLAQDTQYALLDEPTTYLDIAAQFSVMRIMREMADGGKCVIAVLHDIGLAMQFCDRIVVMHRGKICADAAPDALSQSEIWAGVFGVKCIPMKTAEGMRYVFEPGI